ncbi:LOW QUALITY PROTEIN: germinal-center associated nuclear protein [Drosophila albomicans]|uniref:LOW QUALITY PROTEIN: germinal-center associated nuclear protein n=1 Tax=Drosophila albomicans TaxID=7291 RepID=A0A9C6WI65_DROAB|nr:LOW QUALITY PROTEIN: germinal-center associated nuclear protein [Drosophila albomicans]
MEICGLVRGSCERYCPDAEAKMRIQKKLLNYFEYKDGQKQVPGVLVKEFTRSAADAKVPKAKDMRTELCLNKTVEYLLKDILLDERKPFNWVYDFVFDRLRMVRREIVIQQFDPKQTIKLLEPTIMFLAYSRYRLCAEPIEKFDPKICNQHLQECLNMTLCCYKELDDQSDHKEFTLRDLQRRCFIEALYQLFNLGTPEALVRGLTLPAKVREDDTFKLAFGICMNYHRGNLYRVIVDLPKLPHILCAVAAYKLQIIRRHLLEIFTHAYNNKQLTVPTAYLLRLTLVDKTQDFAQLCRHYNIALTPDSKAVHFNKTVFNSAAETVKAQREPFIEAKLQRIYLPEVLLLKKLWL